MISKGEKYDVVIIGGGLGGLLCACILGMEGMKVCVIDRNKQIGGNLQTFVRDKQIFDTGVHYIGGLSEGQNLYKIFKYVGIYDELKLKKMNEDGFDHINFSGDQTSYKLAQGYDAYSEQLFQYFPKEKDAIQKFIVGIKDACKKFPLYHLDGDKPYDFFNEFLSIGANDYLNSITQNRLLKAVLSGNNMLYAGNDQATPFYVMALSTNTYIESSYKCINGGSQIAKLLVKKIRSHGGDIIRNSTVEKINCLNKIAQSVQLVGGQEIQTKNVISNIHPKDTLNLLDITQIRKSYRKRIDSLQDTIGIFSIYLVLKPNMIPYMNHNIYYHESTEIWQNSTNYNEKKWPHSYMISSSATPLSIESNFASCLTVMVYMKYSEVQQWKHTFNTVLHQQKRCDEYEAFKLKKANIVLNKIEKQIPNIKSAIDKIYTSTPLSYRDYIGSPNGSAYGIERNYTAPWKTFLNPKSKIANLYYTGQNVVLHGILGVSISSILTCSEFVGKQYLVNKINNA